MRVFACLSIALFSSCVSTRWNASALLLDAQAIVAEALGDTAGDQSFDKRMVPQVPAPVSLRPCCALGMDLTFRYVGLPLYFIPNIVDIPTLGGHEYDNGMMTLQSNGRAVNIENNGLVYTCRGGFIDLSHVRDNADMTFFLATRLLAALPGPVDIEFTTNDAKVHVHADVPPELLTRFGRYTVAAQLAEWLGYQQGTWHEIAQWWGYESVRGYSEHVSAFSPDDFYSNALGVRLGGLSIRNRAFRSREDYNSGMDAWLVAALKQLGAVPLPTGRAAMQATDGVWWDSRYDLPDNRTVPRRSFEIETPILPWLVSDLKWPSHEPAEIKAACAGASKRSIVVATTLGERAIAELATIEWSPRGWARADFPYANPEKHVVTPADFPRLVVESHRAMVPLFDAGFDKPQAACDATDLEATLRRLANDSGARIGVAASVGDDYQVALRADERFAHSAPLSAVVASLGAIDRGELDRAVEGSIRAAIFGGASVPPTNGGVQEHTAADLLRLLRTVQDGALKPETRDRLLGWMRESPAGAKRLKGALAQEVPVEHLAFGDADERADVGFIGLPDGQKLAIAVLADGAVPSEVKEGAIAAIARATYQCWKHGR